MAVPVGLPDHALLTRAREGDSEAFEALYRRHRGAAIRAAHGYSARTQVAEDAVQESFLRILRSTQAGGGPQTEFRAYLATTVRHVIAGWARSERTIASDDLETLAGADTRDSTAPESRLQWHLLTKAFSSLPTRWQEALWLGEVEGVETSELAERWNMSANSAAALSYRAREGLRVAWLDAHVNEGLVPDGCRPYVSDLARYTAGKLTERREQQVREHLDECAYCRGVLVEVGAAALDLKVVLVPVGAVGGLEARRWCRRRPPREGWARGQDHRDSARPARHRRQHDGRGRRDGDRRGREPAGPTGPGGRRRAHGPSRGRHRPHRRRIRRSDRGAERRIRATSPPTAPRIPATLPAPPP